MSSDDNTQPPASNRRGTTRRSTDTLAALAADYPAFRFRHEHAALHGHRYVAQRRNSADPGLHTLITSDLAELRDTLAADQDRHAAR